MICAELEYSTDYATFSARTHQIRSGKPGPHVQQVIEALSRKYSVRIYDEPVLEAHDPAEDLGA
jgi:hypothetical protein